MRVLGEVVRTVFLRMETCRAGVAFEPRETMVAQYAHALVPGTHFALVDKLAHTVSGACIELGVLLIPEASHEHVASCAGEHGHCFVAFMTQRRGRLDEGLAAVGAGAGYSAGLTGETMFWLYGAFILLHQIALV